MGGSLNFDFRNTFAKGSRVADQFADGDAVASGEEKLTLQFSLSGELKKLVANMSTGMENTAKSSVKRFRLLSFSPQSFLSKRLITSRSKRSRFFKKAW